MTNVEQSIDAPVVQDNKPQEATKIQSDESPLDMVEMREALERGIHASGDTKEDTDEEPTKKHPLQHSWTLWYDSAATKKAANNNWHDALKEIYTFQTVEDFWSIYNNITAATDLAHSANYHLFKTGIRPEWEDIQNKEGGKWAVELATRDKAKLNDLWLYMMLACIGETFAEGDEVCGCVLGVRTRNNRISVWTRNAEDKNTCMSIGKQMKEILSVQHGLEYNSHDTAVKADSSYRNKKIYKI